MLAILDGVVDKTGVALIHAHGRHHNVVFDFHGPDSARREQQRILA
jgi:hypothetical protein